MRNRRGFVVALASSLLIAVTFVAPAMADSIPNSGVASITLRVLRSGNGQQFAVTPRGENVLLPGAGVKGDDVHVFVGPNGGYWYVDKNGNQVDLHDAAAQVAAMRAAAGGSANGAYPQPGLAPYNPNAYAGEAYGQPPQNVTVYNQTAPTQSSGSSGAGAVATGALAGTAGMLGGMAIGATMGYNNDYYGGVPYGHPVYHNGGNPYYAGANGKPVYVNNSTHNNNVNLDQQNSWYNNQAKNNTAQYQNFQANNQNYNRQNVNQAQNFNQAQNAQNLKQGQNARQAGNLQNAQGGEGGGRFGHHQDGSGAARSFGNEAGGGEGGGGFRDKLGGGGGGEGGGGLRDKLGGGGGEGGGGLRDKLGGGEGGGGGFRDKLGGGEGGGGLRGGGGGRRRGR